MPGASEEYSALGSYHTAWKLGFIGSRRSRWFDSDRDKSNGTVEVDETYIVFDRLWIRTRRFQLVTKLKVDQNFFVSCIFFGCLFVFELKEKVRIEIIRLK